MTDHSRRLLDVDGVVVEYGSQHSWSRNSRVRAVDGVSMHVQQGELVALVGESGSGKTSLGQAILRLVDPVAGSIQFEGRELLGLSRRALKPVRRRLQCIYQDPYDSLDARFTVRRIIAEGVLIHQLERTVADVQRRCADALEQAGLRPAELYLDRRPHELSGGQRQRVAIAAALSLEPALLVADEPVSMLDVSLRASFMELLTTLRDNGLGILLITHDLASTGHFADRIYIMNHGQILEEGPAKKVITAPQHPYTAALIDAVPQAGRRRRRARATTIGVGE